MTPSNDRLIAICIVIAFLAGVFSGRSWFEEKQERVICNTFNTVALSSAEIKSEKRTVDKTQHNKVVPISSANLLIKNKTIPLFISDSLVTKKILII